MMRIFKLTLSFVAMMMFAPSLVYAQNAGVPEFFDVVQDIPLMEGLEETQGGAILFDKPEGGIVEVVAHMARVDKDQVLRFYHAVLPQFGWSAVDGTNFYRKAETLSFSFEHEGDENYVRIMVRPTL